MVNILPWSEVCSARVTSLLLLLLLLFNILHGFNCPEDTGSVGEILRSIISTVTFRVTIKIVTDIEFGQSVLTPVHPYGTQIRGGR